MRILLVKMSSMGDLVHNMPMIADIRQRFPDAVIDWVAEQSFVEIARMNSDVARVIPINMRRWKRNLGQRQTWREIAAFRRELKSVRYDAVLDTQGLLKSALVCRWARGPSYGRDWRTAHEAGVGWLYTHSYSIPYTQHAITRCRKLAAYALGYEVPDTPPRYDLKLPPAQLPFTPATPYAMALHGTSRAAKLWPVASWIALCRELAHTHPVIFLPWGSEDERLRAEEIAAAVPACQVLPRLSLTQLAHLLQGAGMVIGLDTGLMHLAVGLGVPTLAIFCDSEIWQVGPYPPAGAHALAIGGMGVVPAPEEAIGAVAQLMKLVAGS